MPLMITLSIFHSLPDNSGNNHWVQVTRARWQRFHQTAAIKAAMRLARPPRGSHCNESNVFDRVVRLVDGASIGLFLTLLFDTTCRFVWLKGSISCERPTWMCYIHFTLSLRFKFTKNLVEGVELKRADAEGHFITQHYNKKNTLCLL